EHDSQWKQHSANPAVHEDCFQGCPGWDDVSLNRDAYLAHKILKKGEKRQHPWERKPSPKRASQLRRPISAEDWPRVGLAVCLAYPDVDNPEAQPYLKRSKRYLALTPAEQKLWQEGEEDDDDDHRDKEDDEDEREGLGQEEDDHRDKEDDEDEEEDE
ncbi:hypothetical protein H0H93_003473, partial [Arthromyces matolae]